MARHEDNHLKLSRRLDDPVAAIGTDGNEYTAALRNDYLNRANRFIQHAVRTFDQSRDKSIVQAFLQGLIKTQAITFAAAGDDVATDFSFQLFAEMDGPIKLYWIEPHQWATIQTDDATWYHAVYTIFGGKLYASQSGAVLSSGTGTLYYIQTDAQTTSDATPAIDSVWDEVMVDIAATYAMEEKDKIPSTEAQTRRWQTVGGMIGR